MSKKPKLSELTLREKISQTAMIAQNTVFDKFTASETAIQYVKENPVGTFFVIGAGNWGDINMANSVAKDFDDDDYAKKYHKWMIEMNDVLKIPLFVAGDCESGMKFQFPKMSLLPGASCVGAVGDEELAYKKGYQTAKEATYAGMNWLWGPPADLAGRSCIMINRDYGDDVEVCKRMVAAEVRGMQDAGVAATMKHFPGPGWVDDRDYHTTPTVNPTSMEEWNKTQRQVYQAAIDAGVYSVMIGHNSFPACDNSRVGKIYRPSTLSKKVITDLLKGEMGFSGVVVTDCINMRALSIVYEDEDVLHKELIKAGNDVILSLRDVGHYLDVIEEAVLSGEIPESRIDDACQRVLDMKEKLGLFTDEIPVPKDLPEELLNEAKVFKKELCERSLTLICDDDKKIPLSKDKIKKVIVFAPPQETGEDAVDLLREVFTREFKARGVEKVEVRKYIDDNKVYEKEDLLPLAEEYDLLIYAPMISHGDKFIDNGYRTMAFAMRYGKKKSIVVSFGSPFVYYDYFYQAETYINAYYPIEESMVGVVKALYGEIPFEGKNRYKLIPDFNDIY